MATKYASVVKYSKWPQNINKLKMGFLYENLPSGANPTIVGYNASAVKNYNATNCLALFKKT
jgi:hypothetical protein